ncbi:type II toxin-antitoxin system VapC family toxin [Hymenobacter monticola]|uniref:PIN domain-containing protein n=1 Tax=Hymenobacter monticola TaxID=1705399 RepID=A0ABY4B4P6_9BACT|nr:PIN domain-containing protein [Hymenobacter monticola]UOE34131.1 PIN domain-containing protein [Hymenobacter monticola]
MRHFFVDTNVLIDYLSGREPFASDAAVLFDLAFTGRVTLYAASISFSNCHYIISRQYRTLNARALLADILPWLAVTDVSADVIAQGLTSGFTDFEDALQYYSARSNPLVEAIVTRNGKDFTLANIPVMEPALAIMLA